MLDEPPAVVEVSPYVFEHAIWAARQGMFCTWVGDMKVFKAKAPKVMRDLMVDFSPALGVLDAAAILGNLGWECGGFEKLQEQQPTIKGSRGGYGWPQWTGKRRVAYEAWCKAKGLAPESDAANYAYLVLELRTSEKRAIAAVTKARDLRKKVIAFERSFLRAGVKHYPGRINYAEAALAAWKEAHGAPTKEPTPALKPAAPKKPAAPARRVSAFDRVIALFRRA